MRLKTHLLMSAALGLAFSAASAVYAQSVPPITPDLRNNAEETVRLQSEGVVETLEAAEEKRKKKKALKPDEAAEALSESAQEEETENSESAAQTPPAGREDAALESGIMGKLPTPENLEALAQKIEQNPKNLDYYFAYAQMADALGDYEKAAQTYEQMLALAPNLGRVRLDLGAMYLRLGRFEDAKRELESVLSAGVPDTVRPNVEKVLAQITNELKEHDISGSLSAGMNWDTNGNSAPMSQSILVLDTLIELSGDALPQDDMQFFTALSANHTYRPRWAQSEDFARRWKTTATHYRTKQSALEDLNIRLLSLKTGPEFVSKKTGITVSPSISRTVIELAGHQYLGTTSANVSLDAPLLQNVLVNAAITAERRNFYNSPTVSTFKDRNGNASQVDLGATYLLTETDILNLGLTHRRETTRQNYYDNQQASVNLGYTRVLPYDAFANVAISYKNTLYDGADALISAKRRHDQERSAGITLGHKLADELTATLGYKYSDTESNIPNYEYDNHRVSGTLTLSF